MSGFRQLTVNNPAEKGLTHEALKESLAKFSGMVYWCMCDEVGSEGTYHTHIYFVLRTPTVHTVVDNRFFQPRFLFHLSFILVV